MKGQVKYRKVDSAPNSASREAPGATISTRPIPRYGSQRTSAASRPHLSDLPSEGAIE